MAAISSPRFQGYTHLTGSPVREGKKSIWGMLLRGLIYVLNELVTYELLVSYPFSDDFKVLRKRFLLGEY